MVFGSWKEISPGRLFDRSLKVHLYIAGGPETVPNEGNIWCIHKEQNYERIERSDVVFSGIICEWNLIDDTIRMKVINSNYSFNLIFDIISKDNFPIISKNPKGFMMYTLQGLVVLSRYRDDSLFELYPSAKSIEVCLPLKQAIDFFNLIHADFREVEAGWVSIAFREVDK